MKEDGRLCLKSKRRKEYAQTRGRARDRGAAGGGAAGVEQGWMEPGKVSKRSMGAHIVCLPNAVDVQLFASGADAPDA